MTALDVIRNSSIIDNKLFLPVQQFDRKLYMEINKHLQSIGGKWNRTKGGFVFEAGIETETAVEQLLDGSFNKKTLNLFETPDELAKRMVELAGIENNESCLEPSAGRGAILKHMVGKSNQIDAIEYSELNRGLLKTRVPSGYTLIHPFDNDFLHCTRKYRKIIANPPFSRNRDIKHIRHMYDCLFNGGRIVTLSSRHWQLSTFSAEREFDSFIKSVNASIEVLPSGTFKQSGTNIETLLIIINK